MLAALPSPPCTDFTSAEGRAIFEEALSAGGLEAFFPLVAQFRTQDEPAFCGLGTLVMALNAMRVDPGRAWKGVWRWYDEQLLSCCKDTKLVEKEGVTLDEFTCLAQCNGLAVEKRHASLEPASGGGVEAFRAAVRHATSRSDAVLCASYNRQGLQQTGAGHFSPIAGYHPERDLVLILDVARFKYPPHWVPLGVLHSAMASHDASTGRARGWTMLSRAHAAPGLVASHQCHAGARGMATREECSEDAAGGMQQEAQAVLQRLTGGQANDVVRDLTAGGAATVLPGGSGRGAAS